MDYAVKLCAADADAQLTLGAFSRKILQWLSSLIFITGRYSGVHAPPFASCWY